MILAQAKSKPRADSIRQLLDTRVTRHLGLPLVQAKQKSQLVFQMEKQHAKRLR